MWRRIELASFFLLCISAVACGFGVPGSGVPRWSVAVRRSTLLASEEGNVRLAVDYIEGFYRIINDGRRVDRMILGACR